MKKHTIKTLLSELDEKFPLVLHTEAGRLASMVRRMRAEKALRIPINMRSGFVISVKTGKATNEMTEQEWEKFYKDLRKKLKREYGIKD